MAPVHLFVAGYSFHIPASTSPISFALATGLIWGNAGKVDRIPVNQKPEVVFPPLNAGEIASHGIGLSEVHARDNSIFRRNLLLSKTPRTELAASEISRSQQWVAT